MRARVSMAAMMKVPLTHKGWFGLCPVYIGGNYRGAPVYVERHWTALPLLMLSELMAVVCLLCFALMDPMAEPVLPLKTTGKLPPGRTMTLPDDDDDHGAGGTGWREGWGAA